MAELLYSKSQGQHYLKDDDGVTPVEVMKSESTGETFIKGEDGEYYKYEAKPSYEPTAYDYAQQAIGQGTLMGFGDELAGAVKGIYGAIGTDKPFSESIDESIDAERARMAQTEEALGMPATLALQAGGGLLTGGVGAGRAIAGKSLAMAPKLYRAAMQGGVQGGITGAGMSEGGVLDRAGGAAQGAATGAVLGPALTGVAHGVGKVGSAVGRMLPGGAQRQAAGLLRSTIPAKDVARLEQEVLAAPHSVVADFAPTDAKRIVGEATRTVGSGPQVKYLKARHRTQASRIVPAVDDIISGENVGQKIDKITRSRQKQASENYGKFYENPVELTPQLKSFFERDVFQDAYTFAQRLANNDGIKLPPLFEVGEDGVKRYLKPNAQLLDYIKQGMDTATDAAYKESGTMGNSVKNLRNQYRDYLDELLPDYREARSAYAGHSAALEAAENGRKFMLSLGDEGKALKGFSRKDIADLGEHELEAFRSGAASALRDKIERKGFGANVTLLFDNPGVKKDLDALLGRDAARAFRKSIKAEAKMAETWAENQGSATSQRLSAGKTMGTVLDVAAGADPTVSVLRGAMNKVAPQPEAVASEISRLMASPKIADKMAAFALLKQRGIQQPLSKAGGLAQGAVSGVGGYLGGRYGASN